MGYEGKGVFAYLNPAMIPYTLQFVTSAKDRKQHLMKPEDLIIKAFDIARHRIYVIFFNRTQAPGIAESWGLTGLGVSTRGAEIFLKSINSMVEVPLALEKLPAPTFTPESWAHTGLRERINGLLHRAAIEPDKVQCEPKDVFLFPTGMAAVYHSTTAALAHRPGAGVVVGLVFASTYSHIARYTGSEFKHVKTAAKESIDELEIWLEEETKAGRTVSFLLVEFPGNPILDTPDLPRLKKLVSPFCL
jgi:cystathionine gamma-synthase